MTFSQTEVYFKELIEDIAQRKGADDGAIIVSVPRKVAAETVPNSMKGRLYALDATRVVSKAYDASH